jgi:poly(A) polymerase
MGEREPVTTEEMDAARAALRRAVRVSAGLGEPDEGPPAARPEAFRAIPPAELLRELDALLLGPRAGTGLEHLETGGALAALFPEVQALVGLHEDVALPLPGRRTGFAHKDVWAHTCKVVDQATATEIVRWAALLHDVGKARTRSVAPDGVVHFLGHAEVGARMAKRILRRLELPAPRAEAIRFLVLHHLRANQYDPSWTDSAVRRFAKEMEEHLDALMALSRADITTQRAARKSEGLGALDELERRAREIREADDKPVALPKGLGTALIEAFGLSPGPIVGRLRRALDEAAERGEVPMQAEPEVYIAWAREHLDALMAGAPRTGEAAPPEAKDE